MQGRRDTLLGLQRSLPVLERQLTQAEAELRMAEEKQALLVGLLAGREKVQTFLALLNQQALASGVRMQRYEPLKTAAPPPAPGQRQSRRNNNRSNAKEKAQPQQDPLQALGYRKSSVALEVSGPFGGVQTFLQRMEEMELLVESSELALQAVVEKADAEPVQAVAASTQLTLKLSFYDLASIPDVSLTGASMSSPS
jgi:type IV pilus assembly protein PilO